MHKTPMAADYRHLCALATVTHNPLNDVRFLAVCARATANWLWEGVNWLPLCLVGVHLVPFQAYFGAGWTLYWRGLFAGAPPPQPAANQPQNRFLAPSGGCRSHLAVVALARPTLVCLRAILPGFWYQTMHISSYSRPTVVSSTGGRLDGRHACRPRV